MKHRHPLPGCLLLVLLGGLYGCSDEDAYTIPAPTDRAPEPTGFQGTVRETMEGGGYTYIRLDTGRRSIWAATPATEVKVGQQVSLPPGHEMESFESRSLGRTFDRIYFVTRVDPLGSGGVDGGENLPPSHPKVTSQAGMGATSLPRADLDFSGIEKPEGGVTVAEVHERKEKLEGRVIALRGRVVKFSARIMDRNWIHLQDGTGAEGTADLTVTTRQTVQEGDTILVRGRLAVDKDFGYGYKYAVLVEEAEVVVEKGAR